MKNIKSKILELLTTKNPITLGELMVKGFNHNISMQNTIKTALLQLRAVGEIRILKGGKELDCVYDYWQIYLNK